MKASCPDCETFRQERALQLRTGEGDLGDLLTRVALHEATAHPTHTPTQGDAMPAHGTPADLTPVRPWGISRLAPYPTTVKLPYATVAIDPTTQLGVFRDHQGKTVEMGKHGTSSGTETSTATNLDSQPDQGHDQDSEQD
jgi:putative ATP-grasp target RiPP